MRVETLFPTVNHLSVEDWHSRQDSKTSDSGLGMHFIDLPGAQLKSWKTLVFTLFWPEAERWVGSNFSMPIERLLRLREI